jgi:hypothetical protein
MRSIVVEVSEFEIEPGPKTVSRLNLALACSRLG